MISKIQTIGLLVLAVASLGFIAMATAGPQYASAAQSCSQKGGDITVNACVNANVEKNNICVGVLSDTLRCQQ